MKKIAYLVAVPLVLAAVGCHSKSSSSGGGSSAAPAPESTPTPPPAPTPVPAQEFQIYGDEGIGGVRPELQVNTTGSLAWSEQSGGAAEGTHFLAVTGAGNDGSLAYAFKDGQARDFSSMKTGGYHTHFFIRLKRALTAGEQVFVTIVDATGSGRSIDISNKTGFDRSSTNWQSVVLQLPDFHNDLSKINPVWKVTFANLASSLDLDLDHIHYDNSL